MLTKIDHIGIAVNDLELELARYQQDYGIKALLREELPQQQVKLAFLNLPGSTVELLAPLGSSGTLHKFLEKNGPGLHHIAYEVADIEASLDQLKKLSYRLIDQSPRSGARNSLIAFIHPTSCAGVLTELVQYKHR